MGLCWNPEIQLVFLRWSIFLIMQFLLNSQPFEYGTLEDVFPSKFDNILYIDVPGAHEDDSKELYDVWTTNRMETLK